MDNVSILRGILILLSTAALIYLAMEYAKKQQLNTVYNENFQEMDDAEEVENDEMLLENEDANTVNQQEPIVKSSSAKPSEPLTNEDYKPVQFKSQKLPKDCFPKDKLTAEDLLPKDAANSKWAQVNPAGQGDVKDQNYLTAGYHVGINTTGSSLRNPNMQLRSEPPNPQMKVSPWNQTTIESDLNRKPLEIGGCE